MDALLDLVGGAPAPAGPTLGDVVRSDAIELLRGLEPGSVAAIITDPPYGIAYHSNHTKGRNPHAPIAGDWNFQIGAFLDEAERALRPGGVAYIFTRWDVYPLWAREVPPSLALRNMIVWDKGNHSSGDLTGNFGFRHEIIMLVAKGRHQLRGKRWPNVWAVPKIAPARLRMPAEKPVELYERALLASSDPGDLVVDTFGGSGPLAEAAQRHGRRFLIGDVDPKMVAMIRTRIGLAPAEIGAPPLPRACPVFDVAPPDPSLWGLHPEDVVAWLAPSPNPTATPDPERTETGHG